MSDIRVCLVVVPDGADLAELESCKPEEVGSLFSTEKQVQANHLANGFSVLYTDSVIADLNPKVVADTIAGMFINNLPGKVIDMRIAYFFKYKDPDTDDDFDEEVAIQLIQIANRFNELRSPNFTYTNSVSMGAIRSRLDVMRSRSDGDDDDDAVGDIASYLSGIGIDPDDEDDDDYRPAKRKRRRKSYTHSRVMTHASNPKKSYHRHGVLVADSKEDLERDRETIKAFLKDFIPGNADWKRELRREVLKRWMDLYAISKKNLKRMEKKHKKSQRKQKGESAEKSMAMDFARRVLSVQQDRWNDPTK